jgi:hypothetical protein
MTPLVLGRMGSVSPAWAIFAPFIEIVRYALGLTPLRVLAWWVWAVGLCLAAAAMRRLGVRAGGLMLSAALVAMGSVVVAKAGGLLAAHVSGEAPTDFVFWLGTAALALGTVSTIMGAVGGWRSLAAGANGLTPQGYRPQ